MNHFYVSNLRNQVRKNATPNVAIFIDYDNIYHGLRDFGENVADGNSDLINLLWNIYPRDTVRTIKAYADFEQLKVDLRKLHTKRVQIKQVYGNGLGEHHRKNASDIELSIDAIESVYKEEIDTYVFVTADSDMIPIMSRMIFKGKKVHLYYIGTNTSQYQDITSYAHLHADLIDIFEIKGQNEIEYWIDKSIKYIQDWYTEPKNKSKLLGGKWLNDGLQNTYFISRNLSSSIIEKLERDLTIKKITERSAEGYVIAADEANIRSRFRTPVGSAR
ncbi:NYN domain-containing protein [Paenibacillus sp. MMS18-CY102]|uniref:NYN domain-containing protein n=1 Tax=Paenibacillus sp. MMS18-CY102 TaxID=2682849 RepID=UPI001365DDBE|nr:NYN domain-containing protein [Paenibacillus sp. MMS18-CY102]MWC27169.1 NYN domain-containing protein [Paenibacillus sp. MMS18-CY102]